jgi:hypothetical protein
MAGVQQIELLRTELSAASKPSSLVVCTYIQSQKLRYMRMCTSIRVWLLDICAGFPLVKSLNSGLSPETEDRNDTPLHDKD